MATKPKLESGCADHHYWFRPSCRASEGLCGRFQEEEGEVSYKTILHSLGFCWFWIFCARPHRLEDGSAGRNRVHLTTASLRDKLLHLRPKWRSIPPVVRLPRTWPILDPHALGTLIKQYALAANKKIVTRRGAMLCALTFFTVLLVDPVVSPTASGLHLLACLDTCRKSFSGTVSTIEWFEEAPRLRKLMASTSADWRRTFLLACQGSDQLPHLSLQPLEPPPGAECYTELLLAAKLL